MNNTAAETENQLTFRGREYSGGSNLRTSVEIQETGDFQLIQESFKFSSLSG